MSDYGHHLQFGAFLTPSAAQPHEVVAIAQLSEQVGLDLVTFQDHPYQPAFLDTWTLLSVVAARTESVRIAPNVANLPLRPPAVLARAVASLDRLSGGRVELGLGAGAFWDAVAAMGGRRLTPGQAVQALQEAVEVIRQVWDGDARGGVRVEGAHYRVVGAKRGPSPAHPVEIWLGAYKPRMLQLTGRRADGWLPSLGYLAGGDVAAGNSIIDQAAADAGRDPRDVRRLLNINGQFLPAGRGPLQGPAEQWAEELADLALTDGISVFLLGTDDPNDLRRFAAEVAPAVRELIDAGRGGGADAAHPSSTMPLRTTDGRPTVTAPVPRSTFAVVPTPDDGTRRSTERAWDESTRPSGPAPDPTRTYTAHERASAQHLIDVHDALRAELARLYDLVEQVAAGELDAGQARSHISQMTMRQNDWVLGAYCMNYCRVVATHHTLEDRSIFPHLRRSKPALAPVIDRLEQEHHVIHDVLERVDRALVAFVSVPDGMPFLRAAVDLLSDSLLSHLSYEERELVEPLASHGLYYDRRSWPDRNSSRRSGTASRS
jgi:alkanesulfonate monooxygenase SsuD/methylene tetrahydromethanopterin reductase-like flavin-dependent oxidoreductase (luciferase family)